MAVSCRARSVLLVLVIVLIGTAADSFDVSVSMVSAGFSVRLRQSADSGDSRLFS